MTNLVFTLLCGAMTAGAQAAEDNWLLFIGTYTHGDSQGIYSLNMKKDTGELTDPMLAVETENPSFLALHSRAPVLYSVGNALNEEGQREGFLNAFSVDGRSGKLPPIHRMPVKGTEPCHLAVSGTNSHIAVANYGNGSVSLFPLDGEGFLEALCGYWTHEGSGTHPTRQKGPHAHSVTFNKEGTGLYVADLGIDKVLRYDFDEEHGLLTLQKEASLSVEAGSGPRHFAFHPAKPFAYVVNELANTVTVCGVEEASGALKYLQTIATLPEDFTGESTTAEIRVHPSGKFVYASNRGHDSIAVFTVDLETGLLDSAGQIPTGGRSPRHFSLSPDGAYCVVGSELSGTVRAFRVNPETGLLEDLNQEVRVPNAVCVLFYSQPSED